MKKLGYLPNKIVRLTIIVLITIIVCFLIIFFLSKNMRSGLSIPENLQSQAKSYEEEIKIVKKWTGIKSLPSWGKDLKVEVKGSEFSREFVVTFSGTKEQIASWIKTEPALKDVEFEKVSDTYYEYILPAKGGAQFAEVLIDYSLNIVTINTYWS